MQPRVLQTGMFTIGSKRVHRRPLRRTARVRKRQISPCLEPIAIPIAAGGGRLRASRNSAAATAGPLSERFHPVDGTGITARTVSIPVMSMRIAPAIAPPTAAARWRRSARTPVAAAST